MRERGFTWILILVLFSLPNGLAAQLEPLENLEETTKKGFFKTYFKDMFKGMTDIGEPLVISGGIGLNLRSYSANGIENRQDPFFYGLNTNLNIRIFKINIPFSLLVTARNTESSLPDFRELVDALKDDIRNDIRAQRDRFVRFGMSPHYKWIKLHLGHRSMNFSKFTLANLNFFGAGTELTPGNWRIAAMYGRLQKAEPIDLSLVQPNIPIYERLGWGAKIGYGTEQESIDLMVFKGEDDPNSIFIPENNPDQPSPEENLTIGLNVQKLFFEKFRFRAETAISALSPNAQDAEADSGMLPRFLFVERNTSEYASAMDASLDYEGAAFTAGVQFKRIDPNYKSLGAYFFNNDIVEYLANLSFGLLDGKINTNLSAGIQANNLDLTKPSTTSRFVYSGDLAYSQDAFSAGANYSNNTTDIGYVLNQDLDSLNAVIITQDAGINLNYSLGSDSLAQHTFTIGGNLQEVGDDIENPLESANSQMWVAHLVYNLILGENGWRFTGRLNYNQNELSGMQIKRTGYGLGISKSLLEDKMNIGFDVNYYQNNNNLNIKSNNQSAQFNLGYNVAKGLSANLNLGLLRTEQDGKDSFSELTGNLGLQYNFNIQPKFKKDKKDKEQIDEEGLSQSESVDPDTKDSNTKGKKQIKEMQSKEINQSEILTEKGAGSVEDLGNGLQKVSLEEEIKRKEEQRSLEAARQIEEAQLAQIKKMEAEKRSLEAARKVEEENQKQAEALRVAELARLEQIKKEEEKSRLETIRRAEEEKQKQEQLARAAELAKQEQIRSSVKEEVRKPEHILKSLGMYEITLETSLRESPASKSKVIIRLKEGIEVSVLEKTNRYWWMVDYDGKIGYCKAALLKN